MKTIRQALLIGLTLLPAFGCWGPQPKGAPELDGPRVPDMDQHGTGDDKASRQRDVVRGLMQHTFAAVGMDVDPELSPNSSRLYFASTQQSKRFDIFYKDAGSSNIVQKTFNPWDDRSPKISPDGRTMAFVSNRRGNWDIYVVSTSPGGKATRVTNGPGDEIHPSWSPDGRILAYSARNARSGQWEIHFYDFRTRTTMMLAGIEGLFPEWSPNGKKIVFQRSRTRAPRWYALWTVNVDGTDLTQLVSSDEWAAINPSWTADSKHVIFSTVAKSPQMRLHDKTADDIWIISVRGTNLTRLTAGIEAEWDPVMASNGRVYFCSTRAGHKNIWSMELNLLEVARIEPAGGRVIRPIQIPTTRRTPPRGADVKGEPSNDFDLLSELDSIDPKED